MKTEAKRLEAFVGDLQKISEQYGIWLNVVGGVVFSGNANLGYCGVDHTSGDLQFEEFKEGETHV